MDVRRTAARALFCAAVLFAPAAPSAAASGTGAAGGTEQAAATARNAPDGAAEPGHPADSEQPSGGGADGSADSPEGAPPEADGAQEPSQKQPFIITLIQKLPDRDLSHIFSLDLSYALTGFRNNGWGIGINYEQKIFRYLSIKAGISSITALVSDQLPNPPEDIVVSLLPMIGWKQIAFRNFMLDFQFGYKFIIQNSNRFADNADYVNSGFSLGVKITILWRRLLGELFSRHISQSDDC
ncbi:MAG: hypothetical protein K2H09_03605 [Treponemataceae bacterium]|nr:hypothetical protein [Treponemataceae bacterium]